MKKFYLGKEVEELEFGIEGPAWRHVEAALDELGVKLDAAIEIARRN